MLSALLKGGERLGTRGNCDVSAVMLDAGHMSRFFSAFPWMPRLASASFSAAFTARDLFATITPAVNGGQRGEAGEAVGHIAARTLFIATPFLLLFLLFWTVATELL